jgi:predicted phosphohydrolase
MNFFLVNLTAKANIKYLSYFAMSLLFFSCASYTPKYGENTGPGNVADTAQNPIQTQRFYLIGDAGYANEPNSQELLGIVSKKLAGEGKNTTLLYLGDNIYPYGMPVKKDTQERKDAEASLTWQLKLSELFPGKTYFIPGNHDWYHGYDGLKEEEKFVEASLGKKTFLPGKGCAIKDVEISDGITMITIDSQWFIEDWDSYPTINDDCPIKTREALFTELEDLLNKNQDKTIVLAIHHPLMSNGTHGGQFSLRKQLFPLKYNIPLPVLGTVINVARKTSGYSTQDLQSRVYGTLARRIKTLIQDKSNVMVVSGHDHNLQYINNDNIHQVISGSGSKVEAANVVNPNDFSYGGTGYAILDVNEDGTAKVSYFGIKNGREEKLFETTMLEVAKPEVKLYANQFPATVTTSVYTPEMVDKTGFHRFLFGQHYRQYYATPIKARTVLLDTLHGGLVPVKTGGGHQTNSLRLADKDGKEYAMRAIRKSATRFLQSVAFKENYIGDALENTFAEEFLMDFYTTAHPYTPFIVGKLADNVGIYHSNPELYFVPKQNALGEYNNDYGDELYMIEEHASKEQKDLPSFGKADDIEGTADVLANLQKDTKYSIDEKAYIKARLFDMLIGDWDRHTDQWKWAKYKDGDKVVYKPIPKDRDQAFTKYDGNLLSILMNIPALRHMQSFREDIRNVKWFNREAYPLDMALIANAKEKDWIDAATYLRDNLTDAEIDNAFVALPKEVQDETIEDIKSNLKARKHHLEEFAREYYAVLQSTVLVKGTDKKDRFVITRLPEGETRVEIYSPAESEHKILDNIYRKSQTKEIWIYGLDDDDIFDVKGSDRKPIVLRILGGQNHDSYTVENGRKVKIYDFKSKENTYTADRRTTFILTDSYETNNYDFEKPKYNVVAGYPSAGYNPDDGVKLGAVLNYTVNNFNRRPYSQKHSIRGHYYFATDGFDVGYRGTFMNIASRWNFGVDVLYTSPNFSINYFGQGNETVNTDDDTGMNYNRVKLQVFRMAPSFFTESRNGSRVDLQAVFESIEVDGTHGRFVDQPGAIPAYLYEHRQYTGVNAKYSFENYDNTSLPALGMSFSLLGGWKTSVNDHSVNFSYAEAALGIIHKLTADNTLVFSTQFNSRVLFSNNYEFYQGAVLGGDNDLRGYRRERFTGKSSFYNSNDIRYTIGNWRNSFIPVKYGVFGGYDYGRVWLQDDTSKKWHQSAGGGIFINGVDAVTARLSYFSGDDGGRFAAALGFSF